MFIDRRDAALQLAAKLEKYRADQPLVLGIPRGGAETAYYIAHHLQADFSLVIVRKLGRPGNPEFAYGALAEDGTVYYTPHAAEEVPYNSRKAIEVQQQKEIERRIRLFRKGVAMTSLKGRTVIITDDGIATGATVVAAIRMCRKLGAARIILAAPVAFQGILTTLRREADEVIILQTPPIFHAVGQAYQVFYNLSDQEALAFLEKWEREKGSHSMPG